VREVLFEPGEDPLGKSLRIQGVYFQVVGVFGTLGSGNRAERDSQTIHIPFSTFQQAFQYGNRVDWLSILAAEGVRASKVEEKARGSCGRATASAPDDLRALGSWNMEEEFDKVQGVFLGIRLLVWIVGIGTLAAGVIGVSNIMLVIVRERTHEIGIRRAIGATPVAVTGQILIEALLLTAAAGYFGLIGGMLSMDAVGGLLSGSESMFFKDPGSGSARPRRPSSSWSPRGSSRA
jgi:ABC-type antimicrobial peptide transport system, permease component